MYTPRTFRVDDSGELAVFMRRHSFCTLVTPGDGGVAISHVPLIVDMKEDRFILSGHLAGVNPHAECLDGGRSTAIFHGPHSYVSPAWYADTREVPTWNYASVHATGSVRTFRDSGSLSGLVDRMIETFESQHDAPWDRVMPADYRHGQLAHIVGFEMTVDHIDGKYKLGQNRTRQDQDKMLAHLESSPDHDSRALGQFIRRYRGLDQVASKPGIGKAL